MLRSEPQDNHKTRQLQQPQDKNKMERREEQHKSKICDASRPFFIFSHLFQSRQNLNIPTNIMTYIEHDIAEIQIETRHVLQTVGPTH